MKLNTINFSIIVFSVIVTGLLILGGREAYYSMKEAHEKQYYEIINNKYFYIYQKIKQARNPAIIAREKEDISRLIKYYDKWKENHNTVINVPLELSVPKFKAYLIKFNEDSTVAKLAYIKKVENPDTYRAEFFWAHKYSMHEEK